jgi:hypothetical protein
MALTYINRGSVGSCRSARRRFVTSKPACCVSFEGIPSLLGIQLEPPRSQGTEIIAPESSARAICDKSFLAPSHLPFIAATILLNSFKAVITKGTATGPSSGR